MSADPWKAQAAALGAFIRTQRALADMSLRDMATVTNVSNAYLSQVERGLHQPSLRVLGAIADALRMPVDQLLAEAGLLKPEAEDDAATGSTTKADAKRPTDAKTDAGRNATVAAILADPALTPDQRHALVSVYRSFVGADTPS